MLISIFIVYLAPSFASAAKNCPGLLTSLPNLNRTARNWSDAIPIRQEWFLPKSVLILANEPMYPNDRLAAMMAENKDHAEVGYFEALDKKGSVLLTSDFAYGDYESSSQKDALFAFLWELDERYPDRARGRVTKIRMVRTHAPRITRDFFTYQDVHRLLYIHAVLEVLGGNEIELEQSILFPGFTGFRNGRGAFVKRTLFIPAHSLSWIGRDYLLNSATQESVRDLRTFLIGKTGYALPSSWFK